MGGLEYFDGGLVEVLVVFGEGVNDLRSGVNFPNIATKTLFCSRKRV